MTSLPHEPANLDAETLRQRYADAVLLHERTQHVGRANRIFMRIHEIGERLVALGGTGDRELLPLLSHPSRKVRRSAAFDIRPFNRDLFLSVMESLVQEGGAIGREAQYDLQSMARREEAEAGPRHPDPLPDPNQLGIINWQQDNPPPAAMSQRQFKDRVLAEFLTGRARQVPALARPAIGLWPQRQVEPAFPLASRHGGDVWAPTDWRWPIYEEEPMCFLGQIYCPDLAGLPGAELLPKEGLLAFFGDHDVISGCFPGGGSEEGAVYHWHEQGLVPTSPPLPPLPEYAREYSATQLVFRPFIDLPHPYSNAIAALGLSKEESDLYWALRASLVQSGIPDEVINDCDLDSKILGWPNPVQSDFELPQIGRNPFLQLAQLPARLGPGGSLYFFIREADLASRCFDRCILEEQNT